MSNNFGKSLFILLCVSTLGIVSGATYNSVSADNQTTTVSTVEASQTTDSTASSKEVTQQPVDQLSDDIKDNSVVADDKTSNEKTATESVKPEVTQPEKEISKPVEQQKPETTQPEKETSKPVEQQKPEATQSEKEVSKPAEEQKPKVTQPEKEVSKTVEQGKQTGQTIPVAEPNQEKDTKAHQVASKEKKTGIALGSPRNFLNKGQKVDKWIRITDDDNVYAFNNDEWNTTDYTSTLKSTTGALNLVGRAVHVIEEYTSTFGILYYRIEVDGVEYVISSGIAKLYGDLNEYDGSLLLLMYNPDDREDMNVTMANYEVLMRYPDRDNTFMGNKVPIFVIPEGYKATKFKGYIMLDNATTLFFDVPVETGSPEEIDALLPGLIEKTMQTQGFYPTNENAKVHLMNLLVEVVPVK